MYTGARMCRHGTLTFFIGRTCVSFAKASTPKGDSKDAGLKSGLGFAFRLNWVKITHFIEANFNLQWIREQSYI